jgi:hypothetical protein
MIGITTKGTIQTGISNNSCRNNVQTGGYSRAMRVRSVSAVLMVATGMLHAQEGRKEEPARGGPGSVDLKVLDIRPSFDGRSYEGHFCFMNHGTRSVTISGQWEPVNGKFWPANIQYQILKNGQWKSVQTTSHGLLHPREILPKTPYEFIVDLGKFDEQDTPLNCRIGVEWDRYWSPPFVLDWKSDRIAGKFRAAKEAHINMLRDALLKSGFRKEMLEGDQFPHQLVKSILDRVSANDAIGRWFGPYGSNLVVDASFLPNGNVLVTFNTLPIREGNTRYSGQIQWNPNKLSRSWFRAHRKKCISALGRDPENLNNVDGKSVLMSFDSDILDLAARTNLCDITIFHYRPANSVDPLPLTAEVMKAAERAMDAFEDWFSKS